MPAWFNTRRIAVTALAMLATCAQAQYANVWPGWAHSREWREQNSQTHSGVVERCRIAGVSTPAPYTPTIFDWRPLVAATVEDKAHLATAIPHFVDPTAVPDSSTAATYLNTSSVPYLTVARACILAGRPVNFFAYTSERSVRGLGPFTNDVGVGHPYGWTNAYTVAGGTNFPPGRTNWYTTDYDIEGVKDIASNLYITADSCVFGYATNGGAWYDGFAMSATNNGSAAWGNCLGGVETDWHATNSMTFSPYWPYLYGPSYSAGFSFWTGYAYTNIDGTMLTVAQAHNSADRLATASSIYTGVTHSAEFYCRPTKAVDDWPYMSFATNEFNGNGSSWSDNMMAYLSDAGGWSTTNRPLSANNTANGQTVSTRPNFSQPPYTLIDHSDLNMIYGEAATIAGYQIQEANTVVLIRWKGDGQGVVWR